MLRTLYVIISLYVDMNFSVYSSWLMFRAFNSLPNLLLDFFSGWLTGLQISLSEMVFRFWSLHLYMYYCRKMFIIFSVDYLRSNILCMPKKACNSYVCKYTPVSKLGCPTNSSAKNFMFASRCGNNDTMPQFEMRYFLIDVFPVV